jgi:hypothetical protein
MAPRRVLALSDEQRGPARRRPVGMHALLQILSPPRPVLHGSPSRAQAQLLLYEYGSASYGSSFYTRIDSAPAAGHWCVMALLYV